MKFFRNITKQAFILIISEVLFVGLLSFGINQYVFSFMENWTWWQYSLFVLGVIAIIAITIIVLEPITKKIKERKSTNMIQSNRDKIQELQTELLQDFFEIQITAAYPQSWKNEIYTVAVNKQHSSYSTYKEIKEKFDSKGITNITIKDFDVTALAALIRFDFSAECCPDNHTRRSIGHITIDRNGFSHISDYKDTQHILDLEETAIDNMVELLTHLQSIAWNQPVVYRKYLGTGHNDGAFNKIYESVHQEISNENISRARIRHYVQELQIIREERLNNYVGLSYNLDGKENEKFMLQDLIKSNLVDSKKGMRIVAEGGYGKSWTLFEIAGQYAEKYLNDNSSSEKVIPVVIEMGKLYGDCASISKKIAQLIFNGEESQVMPFLKNNKIILFVDAMDEAKVDIQSDASRELASFLDAQLDITLVCASRKSCIDKYPLSIPCYAIQALDEKQIKNYLVKTIPGDLIEKVMNDWIGENRKKFLYNNRTPFYISCYVELVCETGDNEFSDTTQLIEKFLNSMIERELRKTGFNSDKATFINFLRELCRLLDAGTEDGEKVVALPENEVIRELTNKIVVDEGQASIKAVGRKLVEIQVLSRDEDEMLLSFAHQNYKEYINRKYPARRFRSWS